jgi:hypothetical protein
MVASTVISIVELLVGSQVVGPAITLNEPIRTSLAVQEGLLSPVASLMQALPSDCASVGCAAKSKLATSNIIIVPYRTASARYRSVQQHFSFLRIVIIGLILSLRQKQSGRLLWTNAFRVGVAWEALKGLQF